MKITKFLPLALALAFATTCQSFADTPSTSANTTLNFTLAPHVHIAVAETSYTATASVNNQYTQLTLDAMLPVFTVYTNTPGQQVYIYAKTGASDAGENGVNALYRLQEEGAGGTTINNYAIAFANTTASHKPSSTDIATLTSGSAASAVEDNPNVIGVSIGHAITHPTGLGGSASDPTQDLNQISYTLQEGTYTFTFTTGTTQMPNTFSTHDSKGTYQATLYMATTSGA